MFIANKILDFGLKEITLTIYGTPSAPLHLMWQRTNDSVVELENKSACIFLLVNTCFSDAK